MNEKKWSGKFDDRRIFLELFAPANYQAREKDLVPDLSPLGRPLK